MTKIKYRNGHKHMVLKINKAQKEKITYKTKDLANLNFHLESSLLDNLAKAWEEQNKKLWKINLLTRRQTNMILIHWIHSLLMLWKITVFIKRNHKFIAINSDRIFPIIFISNFLWGFQTKSANQRQSWKVQTRMYKHFLKSHL